MPKPGVSVRGKCPTMAVMPGLDPGIYAPLSVKSGLRQVDGRVEPGHDP
jgi:hypothetical protein